MLNVSIFGLGYVGATLAGCLVRSGHTVYGVDPLMPTIADLLNSRAVRYEPDLRAYIEYGMAQGKLHLTPAADAIKQTQVTLVCVGTPPDPANGITTDHLAMAMRDIGHALKTKAGYHLVVVRSTVFPGTTRARVASILEHASGSQVGDGDLGLVFQPEFLREGSACADFFTPPFTVIGWLEQTLLDEPHTLDLLHQLYVDVDAPWEHLPLEGAEMLKLVCNTWHALKVAFANEIGAVCAAHDIDGDTVMQVLARDTKLNLSPVYLRPGFAFGGPCLPKDLAALMAFARNKPLYLPLLENIPASNVSHLERVIDRVEQVGVQRVGVLGLAHKPGTGDLRGSPAMALIQRLRSRGFQALGYDDEVTRADTLLATDSFGALVALSDGLIVTDARWREQARASQLPVIDVSVGGVNDGRQP